MKGNVKNWDVLLRWNFINILAVQRATPLNGKSAKYITLMPSELFGLLFEHDGYEQICLIEIIAA